MNLTRSSCLLSALALAPALLAQGPHFLFTTMQQEQTLSGSAGTVLSTIENNELAVLELGTTPCSALSAEKWAPRTMFHTQAGDADNDDNIWETNLFGRIDAVLAGQLTTPVGIHDQRQIFYSVSQPMGTTVSGGPGFRPGDVARIVRDSGGNDGQIEYFMTTEQLQDALGVPSSTPVNIDACCWGPNFGVFFSIEDDTLCNLLTSGPTMVRDGDILCIPAGGGLTWSGSMTVATTTVGGAVVVYTEANVDSMVFNSRITDRNGICQTQIGDTDALEVDWANPFYLAFPSGYGPTVTVPHFIFAGRNLTGAGVLNTLGSGTIHVDSCGPLGTLCGFGPTFGDQMGLLPTSGTQGVPSSLNGLASTYVCRFVTEAQNHQIPVFTPLSLDVASPGPLTWILLYFTPGGPGVVSPSQDFPWGFLCYPDYYALPVVVAGPIPTPTGWGNYTSPPIPWPVDFVLQGVTITTSGSIEASTPTTVEVF